jgi:hypothetical protein
LFLTACSGEYELAIDGVHENLLHTGYQDSSLLKTVSNCRPMWEFFLSFLTSLYRIITASISNLNVNVIDVHSTPFFCPETLVESLYFA